MDEVTYRFRRRPSANSITRCYGTVERPISPRFDLVNHSPDGFEWGYAGSGPAQAALAVLADHTNEQAALRYYQDFKRDFIAVLGDGVDCHEIPAGAIDAWLAQQPGVDDA